MGAHRLHDMQEYEAAIAAHPAVLLFKHSPICPVSVTALVEWQAFVEAHPEVPTAFVDVIGDRSVARGLAAACGVAHQSPQAILFRGGEAAWNASHGAITAASLAAAWARYGAA